MFGRNKWWIVLASALGLVVGNGAINIFGFGVFLKPISESLNISRGTVSGAMGLAVVLTALTTPVFGLAVDRFGYRRALLAGIPLSAIGLAILSFLPASVAGIYVLFAITGLLCVGQTPIAYSKAISTCFDKSRGLALGLGMAGVGIGTALIPHYAGYTILNFGWRNGFIALAIAVIVLAFVPVLLLMRETETAVGDIRRVPALGPEPREAVRSSRFWIISVGFLFAAIAINGTIVHVVPLLTDRGMTVEQAVSMLSSAGIAIILGRLAAGYILDRIFAPYIAVFFFICPMVGIGLIGFGGFGGSALLGIILCGLTIGADIDIIPFLISRYFSLRSFGRLYSFVFAIFSIGTAVGPALMGLSFDQTKSYSPMFLLFEGLLLVGALLILRLGPYVFPAIERTEQVSAPDRTHYCHSGLTARERSD